MPQKDQMEFINKKFLFILIISFFIHVLIIFSFNFKVLKKNKILQFPNKIEINLENYNENNNKLENSFNDYSRILNLKPESLKKINYERINIKNLKINIQKKVSKVSTKIKNISDITQKLYNLTDIPAGIPTNLSNNMKRSSIEKKGNLGRLRKGSNSNGSSTSKNKIISKYLSKIRIIIEKHKKYPLIARKRIIEGKVFLQFELMNNGTVKNIKILKSSGSIILDNAAKKAILSSTPFPEFPKMLKLKKINVKLIILFKLS